MAEGRKIVGKNVTCGGMRLTTYFHLFRNEPLLTLTLYAEYEDLNGAAYEYPPKCVNDVNFFKNHVTQFMTIWMTFVEGKKTVKPIRIH
ncbi:MAG: hypothetical protein NTU98_00585 [Bacteroidetes bacterium]|nr:hypothetical protein [Bacteroidota bacterium]